MKRMSRGKSARHRGLRAKSRTRAQSRGGRGLVTERKDGSVYHQDRMRWAARLGTFRYDDAAQALTDLLKPEQETP